MNQPILDPFDRIKYYAVKIAGLILFLYVVGKVVLHEIGY
jgi:hypothetical protein